MLHNRLVNQLWVFNRFPSRGVENLLLYLRVSLERPADFDGELFFGTCIFELFVFIEELFHLAMILFQEIDRRHLLYTRRLGLFLAAAGGSLGSLRGHGELPCCETGTGTRGHRKGQVGDGPDPPRDFFSSGAVAWRTETLGSMPPPGHPRP